MLLLHSSNKNKINCQLARNTFTFLKKAEAAEAVTLCQVASENRRNGGSVGGRRSAGAPKGDYNNDRMVVLIPAQSAMLVNAE